MQKRGTILVLCTSPHRDVSTSEVQEDTVSVLCSGQNIRKCSVKQLGQQKPNFMWHQHGIGVKTESLFK